MLDLRKVLAGVAIALSLSACKGVNAINGVATFLDLTVNKPGAGLTLGATFSGLATATTAAFTIAGTPASLRQ
jgi:hypothetical protein